MVGGKVVDIWIWEDAHVSVVVKEGKKCLQVSLEKNENSLSIMRGDSVWWQLGHAYWSSEDRSIRDAKIKRFGLSTPADDCLCKERKR